MNLRYFFSFNIHVYFSKFHIEHCFGYISYILICCIFIFVQFKIFSNFPWDFVFDKYVFTSMLFNFQVFRYFIIFPLFYFNFIMIKKDTMYDFNFIKFVKVSSISLDMVYLGECTTDTWEDCILFVLDGMFYKCQLDPIGLWYYVVLLCPCLFSVWYFYWLLRKEFQYLQLSPFKSVKFASCILELCF